jgi:hypothetical protein
MAAKFGPIEKRFKKLLTSNGMNFSEEQPGAGGPFLITKEMKTFSKSLK